MAFELWRAILNCCLQNMDIISAFLQVLEAAEIYIDLGDDDHDHDHDHDDDDDDDDDRLIGRC